eukprot:795320_1
MFNFSNESQKNQFDKIVQEYLSINQQTENAFMRNTQLAESAYLNQWKHLNQLRLHNQNANWSNFIHHLQQLNASAKLNTIPPVPNNTLLPHQPPANTTTHNTVKPTSPKPTTSDSKPMHKINPPSNSSNTLAMDNTKQKFKSNKSTEQYECRIKGCSKKYTTKGNLNRHLKDFHRLNSDLSPMPKDGITRTKKKGKSVSNTPANSVECNDKTASHARRDDDDDEFEFYCVHAPCGEDDAHKVGFHTIDNMKQHALHVHSMTEDQVPGYLAQCKQTALRRNVAHESLPPPTITIPRKRPTFVTQNAFNIDTKGGKEGNVVVHKPVNIVTMNKHNPFSTNVAQPVQNATAPPFPTFILNNHMPVINLAAHNNPNRLNVQQRQLSNSVNLNPFVNINPVQMNQVNKQQVQVPMLQILANNASNNTLNTALMHISTMNNNHKANGMKSLITEMLKTNQTQIKNKNNNGMFGNGILNNIHINTLNALNRIPNVVASSAQPKLCGNKGASSGLDVLLQAVDALDDGKEKEEASGRKMRSRKRKIESQAMHTMNHHKRRKLCAEDARIEEDAVSDTFSCDVCGDVFTKQSHLSEHRKEKHET